MKNIHLIAAAVLLMASGLALAQSAAPARVTFSIEQQPLGSALTAFARQAQVQILQRDEEVSTHGKIAPAVNGTFSPLEALTRLLANTGLKFEFINDRTVRIVADETARAPASAIRPAAGEVKLARVEQTRPAAAGSDPAREDEEAETNKGIPELLVKGRRTSNVDIQRTEDDVQPYVVFDREQIERSMAGNLTELFKTLLPMNAVQGTPNQATSTSSPDGNQSLINLRGLGANQTLILVDGRRMPNIHRGSTAGQPDINGIPLSAIERIEVLPSTASGIYGGGATGGVINIVTRSDYAGVDAGLRYTNLFDTDAAERRIDLSAGFGLEGGRTQVLLTGSYSDSNALLTADRDLVARARALQLANNRNAFYAPPVPPFGYTSNIRSADGQNLQLKSVYGGSVLTSDRTFVPTGYAGAASDRAAGLVANAGRYNLDIPNDIDGGQQSLLNNPVVRSAVMHVRRSFGSRVDAFADVSWLDNVGETLVSEVPNTAVIDSDAPNNPFVNPIVVTFPGTGLAFPFGSTSETMRITAGAIVRLPHDWTAAVDHVWSRSRFSYYETAPATGDPADDGNSVDLAVSNGTLDVLRDVNVYPLDFSPYLLDSPNLIYGPAASILRDSNLRLSGPLLRLPGGPLSLSAVASRREEKAETSFQYNVFAGIELGVFYFPERMQTVNSLYVETRAPLFSRANARPGLQTLELQVSARRDEYETVAPTPTLALVPSRSGPFPTLIYDTRRAEATKYTAGFRFAPIQDLTLRASIGTGFLPPSINQIARKVQSTANLTLVDPKRSRVSAPTGPITRFTGSNPDLTPEDSRSWSAGLVFTPRFAPDFRLSVDYTDIRKTNEISNLNAQLAVDLEDFLPAGRVTRAALTQQDRDLGYSAGAITGLDLTLINLAQTRLRAYDVQADYAMHTQRMGVFRFNVLGTWQPDFKRQTTPVAPLIDFTGFSGGPLEWRGSAGITWEQGPWTLNWSTQYYNSYRAYAATASSAVIASTLLNQGSADIPSQAYSDFNVRYRFAPAAAPALFENTEITLGIQNVFDRLPPILATTAATGGYSTYGDPRLRRYSIALRKQF